MCGRRPDEDADLEFLAQLRRGNSLRQVAARLGIFPSAVQKRARRLVLRGWVRREASGEVVTYSVTVEGERVLAAAQAAGRQHGVRLVRLHGVRLVAPVLRGPGADISADRLQGTITRLRHWERVNGCATAANYDVAIQVNPRQVVAHLPSVQGTLDTGYREFVRIAAALTDRLAEAGFLLGDWKVGKGEFALLLHPCAVSWASSTNLSAATVVADGDGKRLIWVDHSTGIPELECERINVLKQMLSEPYLPSDNWRSWLERLTSNPNFPDAHVL